MPSILIAAKYAPPFRQWEGAGIERGSPMNIVQKITSLIERLKQHLTKLKFKFTVALKIDVKITNQYKIKQ